MSIRKALLTGFVSFVSFAAIAITNSQSSAAWTAKAAGGKPPSYQQPVTTTIFDSDTSGALLLMRSDDYNGAGQATYSAIAASKGADFVVARAITADGKWQLDLSDQSGRSLWITPNQPVNDSQPAAPPAGNYVIQKAYSACRDQNGNAVPYPLLVNGNGNCSMAVNFFYGGILYKLLMRPDSLDATLCPPGGCPPTGLAQVACNAVSANQCTNWTITPNASAQLVGVSNLYSYTGPRGSEWVFIGQYYNTFRVNAVKQ